MPPSLNLEVLAPELILAVGAMALLMLGVFTRRERGELILWLAVALLAIAGIFVARATGTTEPTRPESPCPIARSCDKRSLRATARTIGATPPTSHSSGATPTTAYSHMPRSIERAAAGFAGGRVASAHAIHGMQATAAIDTIGSA